MTDNKWSLNEAWLAKKASELHDTGKIISSPAYQPVDWIDAVVPGTVLTTSSTSVGDVVNWPNNLPLVYFVKLVLRDQQMRLLSENFYWQSSQSPADYSALRNLPWIKPDATVRINQDQDEYVLNASITNSASSGVAFFIRLKLLRSIAGADKRVLPSLYDDNYLSLLPGEQKSVTIRCAQADAGASEPELWIEAWNIRPMQVPKAI
jgi:hypothetical protein